MGKNQSLSDGASGGWSKAAISSSEPGGENKFFGFVNFGSESPSPGNVAVAGGVAESLNRLNR